MKKKITFIIILLVIGIITATTVYASTILNVKFDGTFNYDDATRVVEIVNKERTSRGLKALEIDYNLTKIAEERAKESAVYFSHTRPNGDEWETLNVSGENLHAGSTTAEDAVSEWMSSILGHRENILDSRFKSIGVAAFKTKSGTTYWVQIFKFSKSSDTSVSTGSKNVTSSVNVKLSYINNISIYDLQYKKIAVGEEYTISKAALLTGEKNHSIVVNNSNFKFTSSDEAIATVDSKGKIKGLANGKVTISASFAGKTSKYEIQVGEIPKVVEKLSFASSEYSMRVGKTLLFNVNVTPSNAKTTLKWRSSNTAVATVDDSGNVTTKSVGSTLITVTSSNGKKASFKLNVNELKIKNLYITDYMNALYVGETTMVKTALYPSDATEKVKFTSSNTKVLTVDSRGLVTAVGTGTATIKAESSATSDSVEITVRSKKIADVEKEIDNTKKEVLISRVSLDCNEITLKVGETFKPTITVFPSNTTEAIKPLWGGFDYRVAELSGDGTVKGISAGEGIIKVYVGKNMVEASYKVKVIAPDSVERLEFPFLPSSLTTNEVRKMVVNVYPSTAKDNTKLVWSSSNTEVATISQEGILFTHSSGETTITITASNGVKVSAVLTVN